MSRTTPIKAEGSHIFKTIFRVEDYFDHSQKSFPTKSDNENTVHFIRISEWSFFGHVQACEQALAIKVHDFRVFLTESHTILEVALPSMQLCQQVVKEGVVIHGNRRFPQLPNGSVYQEPSLINVHNIPFGLAPGDLTKELQSLFNPFGTLVRIDTKSYQHGERVYGTDEAVVYLIPNGKLSPENGLTSKIWNRRLTLNLPSTLKRGTISSETSQASAVAVALAQSEEVIPSFSFLQLVDFIWRQLCEYTFFEFLLRAYTFVYFAKMLLFS